MAARKSSSENINSTHWFLYFFDFFLLKSISFSSLREAFVIFVYFGSQD